MPMLSLQWVAPRIVLRLAQLVAHQVALRQKYKMQTAVAIVNLLVQRLLFRTPQLVIVTAQQVALRNKYDC